MSRTARRQAGKCDGDATRKGANAAACRFGRGGEGGGKGRCRRRGKGRCRTMLTQLQRSGRAGPHVWTMHTQGRARAAHGSHLERRPAVEGGMLVLTVSTTTSFPYWQGEGSAKQDRQLAILLFCYFVDRYEYLELFCMIRVAPDGRVSTCSYRRLLHFRDASLHGRHTRYTICRTKQVRRPPPPPPPPYRLTHSVTGHSDHARPIR